MSEEYCEICAENCSCHTESLNAEKLKKIYIAVTEGGGSEEEDYYKYWSKYAMKRTLEKIKQICEVVEA